MNGNQLDADRGDRSSDSEELLMENERNTRYQPPVERLLTFGESDRITPDEWPDRARSPSRTRSLSCRPFAYGFFTD
jgi:hypothetical protein